MKKFTLLFTMMLCAICASAAIVTDVITATDLAATGITYTPFSNVTKSSKAVYLGCTAKNSNGSIQINTGSKDSYYYGIATSTSGGLVRKVTIDWDTSTTDGRTLNVIGSNTPFSNIGKTYLSQGTKIGTIVYGTSTELTITDEYKYIALASNKSAMYLTSISIEWEEQTVTKCATPIIDMPVIDYGRSDVDKRNVIITCATEGATIHYATYNFADNPNGELTDADYKVYDPTNPPALACSGTYGIKTYATLEGLENSDIAEWTFVYNQYGSANDLDDFKTQGIETVQEGYYHLLYCPVYVLAQKGKYLYVRDDNNNALLIFATLGLTLTNGQAFPSKTFAGQSIRYNGTFEMTEPRVLEDVLDTTVPDKTLPFEKTIADLSVKETRGDTEYFKEQSQYVIIKGVKIDSSNKTLVVGENSLPYYLGRFSTSLPENLEDFYDAVGIVEIYNGNVQLAVTEFKDLSPEQVYVNGEAATKTAPYTYTYTAQLSHGATISVSESTTTTRSATTVYGLADDYAQLNTTANLVENGTGKLFWGGNYTTTINTADKTISLQSEDAYPAKLRVITNFEPGNENWTYSNTEYLADNNNGVYEFADVPFVTPGKFIITADASSTTKAEIDDLALGAADATNNVLATGGTVVLKAWGAESPIQIKTEADGYVQANYKLTVDLNNFNITSSMLTGINEIEAEGAEIEVGEGNISVAGGKATIYNAAGQTIATANNSQVAVPAGLYIVKVNGKATKVIVK